MRYRRFGDRFVIRLESGESLTEELEELVRREGIGFADVSAAGAVSWIRLGYWHADTRKYAYHEFDEQLEVVSFQGNISLEQNDSPHLHIHGVFGHPDFSVVAGHVKEARVNPTLEIWLRAEEIPIRRVRDQETGLDMLDLPEQSDKRRAA